MMRAILTTIALTLAMALSTVAQATMDTDGDGNVSFPELQAVYPDASADAFALLDTDADGVLNQAEVEAAVAAGQLPG